MRRFGPFRLNKEILVSVKTLAIQLYNHVRFVNDRLRINSQLIDATTGGNLWAQRYDGSLEDVFAIQDGVTHKIVRAISIQLIPAEEIRSAQKSTSNTLAYKTFLRASQLRPFDSAHEFEKAVYFYERAIELDPAYGDAHAALARLYWRVCIDELENVVAVPRFRARDKMFYYARKASEFPTASGYQVRALIMGKQNRWEDALDEAMRAIRLNPKFSNGMATISYLLVKMGRLTEAQFYLNEAMRLDPEEKSYWLRASIMFHLEEYEVAASQLQDFVEDSPQDDSLQLLLAASYGHLGKYVEGNIAVRRFDELRAKKGLLTPFAVSELNHWGFGDGTARKRIQDGLLRAGMPKY